MTVAVAREAAVQQRAEDVARVGAAGACDFFRGAGGDDAATVLAAFWSKIDDMVGALDDVEIMFDDEHCVA